jgi:hypothetical protein
VLRHDAAGNEPLAGAQRAARRAGQPRRAPREPLDHRRVEISPGFTRPSGRRRSTPAPSSSPRCAWRLLSTLELFRWWRVEDWAAIQDAMLGIAPAPVATAVVPEEPAPGPTTPTR